MMVRILFYVLESGVLAGVVACIALPLCNGALKILGHAQRFAKARVFLFVWAGFCAIGIVGGEWVGPTFLGVYQLAALAVVISVVARVLAAIVAKKFRIVRVGEESTDEGDGSQPEPITSRRTPARVATARYPGR